MVPKVGLEPTRLIRPRDFKSPAYHQFRHLGPETKRAPCGALLGLWMERLRRCTIRTSGRTHSSSEEVAAVIGCSEERSFGSLVVWCPRSDSNRHFVRNRGLRPGRLPIPPLGQSLLRVAFLVPWVGLEPTRYLYQQILNLPRLPVPPPGLLFIVYHSEGQ